MLAVNEMLPLRPASTVEEPLNAIGVAVKEQGSAQPKYHLYPCDMLETEPDLKRETEPDLKQETEPDLKRETEPDLKVETEPDLKVETEPDLKVETEPDLKLETEPDFKLELEQGPETESELESQPEPEPESELNSQPEVNQELEPVLDLDIEPEVYLELESGPEPEDETHGEPSSEHESGGKSEPEPKQDKLESEPELKPEPEPEPGTSGSATPCPLTVLSSDTDSSDERTAKAHVVHLKSRKRRISHTSSSSGSDSDSHSRFDDIDYNNLKPSELRALIEEARRVRALPRKCRCPKRRWEDLPIKGPTKPSGKITIGKGNWSESKRECAYCSSGIAHAHHVPRDPWQLERPDRPRRRKPQPARINYAPPSSSPAKVPVVVDVPVVDLTVEDDIPVPIVVAEQVTVSTSNQVIVLSSDEDELVCEKVIKPPTVIVEAVPALPEPAEPWPEPNIDLGNWDEALNLLADICGPSNNGTAPKEQPVARPATPAEEWCCPICLETKCSVPEIMSTVCGHIFCADCIRSAVRVHHKCPTCRKRLTAKQFHKIFI